MDETKFIQNIKKLSIVAPIAKPKQIIECPEVKDQCKCSPPKASPIKTIEEDSQPEIATIRTIEDHSQSETVPTKTIKTDSQLKTTDIETNAEKQTSKVSQIHSIQGTKKMSEIVSTLQEQNNMVEYENFDKRITGRPRNCICEEDQCECSISPKKSLSPKASEIKQDEIEVENDEIVKQPCKCVCGNDKCKCTRHPRKCIFISVAKIKPRQNIKKLSGISVANRCPCNIDQCKCDHQQSPSETSEITIISEEIGKTENENKTETYKCQCGKDKCKCKRSPKKLGSLKMVKSDTETPTYKCLCGKPQCKCNIPKENNVEDTLTEKNEKVDAEKQKLLPQTHKLVIPKVNNSIQDIKDMSAAALIEQCLCGKDQSKCIRLRQKLMSVKVAQIEPLEDIKSISAGALEKLEISKINSIQDIQNMSIATLINLCKCNNEQCQCNRLLEILTSSKDAPGDPNQELSVTALQKFNSSNLNSVQHVKTNQCRCKRLLHKLSPSNVAPLVEPTRDIKNISPVSTEKFYSQETSNMSTTALKKLCQCSTDPTKCTRFSETLTSSKTTAVEHPKILCKCNRPSQEEVFAAVPGVSSGEDASTLKKEESETIDTNPIDVLHQACKCLCSKNQSLTKLCKCYNDLKKLTSSKVAQSTQDNKNFDPTVDALIKQCKCKNPQCQRTQNDYTHSINNKSETALEILQYPNSSKINALQDINNLSAAVLGKLETAIASKIKSSQDMEDVSLDDLIKLCECSNEQCQCSRLIKTLTSSKVEQVKPAQDNNVSAAALVKVDPKNGSKMNSIQDNKNLSAAVLEKLNSAMASKVSAIEDFQNLSVEALAKFCKCNNEQCQCNRLLQKINKNKTSQEIRNISAAALEKLKSSKISNSNSIQDIKNISTASLNKLDPELASKINSIQDTQDVRASGLLKLCKCSNKQCQCSRLLEKLTSSKVEEGKHSQNFKNISAPGLEKSDSFKTSNIDNLSAATLIKLCSCSNEQCQCSRLLEKLMSSTGEQLKPTQAVNTVSAASLEKGHANGSKINSIQNTKNISAAVLRKLASKVSAIQDVQNVSAEALVKLCKCINEKCQCNRLLEKLTSSKVDQNKNIGAASLDKLNQPLAAEVSYIQNTLCECKNKQCRCRRPLEKLISSKVEQLESSKTSNINAIQDTENISVASLNTLDLELASEINSIRDTRDISAAALIKLCKCSNEKCQCLVEKLTSSKLEQVKPSQQINISATTLENLKSSKTSNINSIQDGAALRQLDPALASKTHSIQSISAAELIKLCECSNEQCQCSRLLEKLTSSKIEQGKHSQDFKNVSATAVEKLRSSKPSVINSTKSIKNISAASLNKLDPALASKLNPIQDNQDITADALIKLCECSNEQCQCRRLLEKLTSSKYFQDGENISVAALETLKSSKTKDIEDMSESAFIKLCECNNDQYQCNHQQERVSRINFTENIKNISAIVSQDECTYSKDPCKCTSLLEELDESIEEPCKCGKERCECIRRPDILGSSNVPGVSSDEDASAIKAELKLQLKNENLEDSCACSENICECYNLLRTCLFNRCCTNLIQAAPIECVCDTLEKKVSPNESEDKLIEPPVKLQQKKVTQALSKTCKCPCHKLNCKCQVPPEKMNGQKIVKVKSNQNINEFSATIPIEQKGKNNFDTEELNKETLQNECECKCGKCGCKCYNLLGTPASPKFGKDTSTQDITNTSTTSAVEKAKTKSKNKKLNKKATKGLKPRPLKTIAIGHEEKVVPPTCKCSRVKHKSKRTGLPKKCTDSKIGKVKSLEHLISASGPISKQRNECSCYKHQCKCGSLLETNECSVCEKEYCTCRDYFQEEANKFVNDVRYELQRLQRDQFAATEQEIKPLLVTSRFCKVCEDTKVCVILHNKENKADLLKLYNEDRDLETIFQSTQERQRSINLPSDYKKKKSTFGGKDIIMSHSFKEIQPTLDLKKAVYTKTKNINKKQEIPTIHAPVSPIDSDDTTKECKTVENKNRPLLWYSSELPHTA